MVEKLYPPIIGSSIPAFYADNEGTVIKITVPFSMNKAVDAIDITGLVLKIKTVQSNTFLKTLECTEEDLREALLTRTASFIWQLSEETDSSMLPRVGQYLKVQMAYKQSEDVVGYFSTVAIGKYTAKPRVSIDNIDPEKPNYKKSYIGLYESTDDKSERPYSYIFNLYDRYQNLIETSGWQLHNSQVNNILSESKALEKAIDKYTYTSYLEPNTEYFIEYGVRTINNLEVYSPLYVCMQIEGIRPEIPASLYANNYFEDAYIELSLVAAAGAYPQTSGSYIIERADSRDNYTKWITLNKVNFSSYPDFTLWKYKDFTIEQGLKYLYCIQQYNDEGIYSDKMYANSSNTNIIDEMAVFADFEDMFLFDGKKQIKIRFNPKVSSFKTNLMESKVNTIGSKYPYIFRNGAVEYKEFPISGLISYLVDNNNLFVDYEDELNLISPNITRNNNLIKEQINVPTTTLESYNVAAERIFKLKLLNWLNDGKIKLFKSPEEGNYLVRLMNVSLSPEDRLSRMLHTFSATAYEMEEFSYENLISLGFFDLNEPTDIFEGYETIKICDKIKDLVEGQYIKLNNYQVVEWLSIFAPPWTRLHLGQDITNAEEIVISQNGAFVIQSKNEDTPLPNVFMTYEDAIQSQELLNTQEGTITYKYKISSVVSSEFEEIKTISIKNVIETYTGPQIDICARQIVDNKVIEVLKFFVLDFSLKSIINIRHSGSNYYLDGTDLLISNFDPCSIYVLNNNNYIVQNNELVQIEQIDTSISMKLENGQTIELNEPSVISLPQDRYSEITFGNGIVLNCAYQLKTTEYFEN